MILPAWWQTTWAKAGAVLLIAGLLVLIYRWRVALLRSSNRELERLVEQRTHELAVANESLMTLSVTDALTGMKNRRYLHLCMPEYAAETLRRYEVLTRAGRDPVQENSDLVFLLVDLDLFKEVNDQYGHLRGDQVLIDLHHVLRKLMRESDTLVRWGGEEFLVVARNSSRAEAGIMAERIRAAVASHVFTFEDGTPLRMTCSIGFAAFPFLPEQFNRFSWEEVVDVADICLYAAKRAGRNRWVGVVSRDVANPETLLSRIRHNIAQVIASNELTLLTSAEVAPKHWSEAHAV